MMRICSPCLGSVRNGVALILVVIVIALLTTAGLSFALLMQQSHMSSNEAIRKFESKNSAQSATMVALNYAAKSNQQRQAVGGHQNNPNYFVDSLLAQPFDELSMTGMSTTASWVESESAESESSVATDSISLPAEFELSAPGFVIFETKSNTPTPNTEIAADLDGEIRLGLTDESTKISLQRLLIWERQGADASSILQLACGLSPSQADHLLDWADSDSTARENGGERKEYAQLGLTYGPANRIPRSYQELCLIPGFSLKKIFGQRWLLPAFEGQTSGFEIGLEDLNTPSSTWSAATDTETETSFSEFSSTDFESAGQDSLIDTLSFFNQHRLTDNGGQRLVEINQTDLSKLHRELTTKLDVELANYIVLCRQFGAQPEIISQAPEGTQMGELNSIKLDATKGSAKLRSVVDLIDSHVIVPQEKDSLIYNSPLIRNESDPSFEDKLALLSASCFFVTAAEFSSGRIQKESQWLPLIPELSSSAIQWLKQQQGENSFVTTTDSLSNFQGTRSYWTTPFVKAYLDEEISAKDFQILMDNLCEQGDSFSAWILGHSGDFQHPILARCIVNGSENGARQLYWQPMYFPPDVANSLLQRLSSESSSTILP